MSTVMRSARGASAFTQADCSSFDSFGEDGLVFTKTADAPTKTWAPLIDQLLRIRNYKDDFDGEGSEAPHPSLVDGAITLAQYFEAMGYLPADRVLASVNGTVSFEWYTPLGYQEVEVVSPIDADAYWLPKGADRATLVRLTRRSYE